MNNSLSFAKLVKYIEGYSFGEFFNADNVDNFMNYLFDVSKEYRRAKWHCYYGSSKLVIIMDEEDIVFKIPFNSAWDEYSDSGYSFFYGAPSISTWDYCEAEEARYEIAKENGFSNYLAKTEIVYNTKNGIRIYIQPKCFIYSNRNTTSKRKIRTFSKWMKTSLPIDDAKWLNTFIDYHGAYKLKQFLNFLVNEDWDDDLRYENIGYTLDGKPVLIDYSSYMEQYIDFQDLDQDL